MSALLRPSFTALIGVLCILLLGVGAAGLRFDASYRAYFDADDPMLRAFDAVNDRFDPNDALLVLVVAPPGESVLSPRGLELVRSLTRAAEHLPHVRRVDSLTNYPWIEADPEGFRIRDLLPSGPVDANVATEVRRLAASDRLIEGALVDRAGRAAVVMITFQHPARAERPAQTLLHGGADALSEWAPVMRAARAMLARHESSGYALHLSGIVAMNHAFAEATLHDTLTLIPLGFALLFAFVAWALRSLVAALHVFLLSVLTQIAALGLLGWSGVPLTSTVAMAPLMLLTITVADGVHVLLTLRAHQIALLRAGATESLAEQIAAAFREQRRPVLLATATTVVGFLTMNYSAVPTYRVLGNVVAGGACIAGVLTLVWLPAMLRLLPPQWHPTRSTDASFGVARLLHALDEGGGVQARTRRPALWLWGGAAVLCALSLFGWSRLRVDDAFTQYFSPALDFRAAADAQSAYIGGLYEIEYAIDSGHRGGVHDPAYLRRVDAFVRFLEAQPETRHVHAWTRVLQRIHQRMNESEGRPAPIDALPGTAPMAAQYLLMYQLSLPVGHDANNLVDVDQSSSRVVVGFGEMTSAQMLAMERRIDTWWRIHGGALKASHAGSAQVNPAGAQPAHVITQEHGAINLIFSHLGGRNVEAMLWANVWGVLAIAALIALSLRNLSTGLLSAGMNLVPLGLAFAVWGLTVRDVGLSLSVAAGMTLGILDHNAVHLLTAYHAQRRRLGQVAPALKEALLEVAPGILVTNLALVVGFGVLAASTFQLNGQLGAFTVLTLLLALLVNLVLIPSAVLLYAALRARRARTRAGTNFVERPEGSGGA